MTEGPPFQDARSMLRHFMRVAGCGDMQAEHVINAYAHELADKILAASEASERQGHSMTPSELADLIRSEMP